MRIYTWSDMPATEVRPGARGRNIDGEKASISLFEMAPGAEGAMHDHDNEQINYVLEGELEFSTGKEVLVLKAGQVVVFSPHEPHQVRNTSVSPAKHIGVLSPPRRGGLK